MKKGKNVLSDGLVDKLTEMHGSLDLETFTTDVIDGLAPNVQRGALGLVKA